MANYYFDTTSTNPWHNLALEKHLANRILPNDTILYLWQNEKTVVIGRNQNALRECNAKLLESEGGYLARRTTGGGAVYHDLGNLNFTFIADPQQYDLTRQMKVVQRACDRFGIETELSGRNDIITLDGRKFSGNAFSTIGHSMIQHGTIMISVDESMIEKYLTPSKEKLQSKGVKSVKSRVCNLASIHPGITVASMKRALIEAYREEYGEANAFPETLLRGEAIRAYYNDFASWDWRYGKSPECSTTLSKRFDWGEIQIHMQLKGLIVDECTVFSDTLEVGLPDFVQNVLPGKRYDMQDISISKYESQLSKAQYAMFLDVVNWLKDEEI